MPHKFRRFLRFATVSGVGWLCDLTTFAALLKFFEISEFSANFISSFVGITFVWFTSLAAVFDQKKHPNGRFMIAYWSFQLFSIVTYSHLLQVTEIGLSLLGFFGSLVIHLGIVAKIVVTPLNLITNFYFMKWLLNYIQRPVFIRN